MKNIIQKSFKMPIILWVLLCVCIPSWVHPRTEAAPGWDLSEEDLKFLEQAQKDVQKYVEALPTEASLRAKGYNDEQIKNAETKEKFDREVERLSKMSEEDLLKEIEKAISDVGAAPQAPVEQPYVPSKTPVAIEPAPAPKPTAAMSAKQHAALQLIDLTITGIINFLRKAQIIAELPGKIQSWQKEGKLKNWPASLSWNMFKAQVEDLEAKLHKLKDHDPRSNSYKYLDEFIKDEGTYNNLVKLRDSLNKNESKIALSPFGMDKMTSESREATRTALLSLHEGLTILGIPAGLDRIFEKFEPTAKKIKESEEAAHKRALEQSKMPRYSEPARVVSPRPTRDVTTRERDRGGYDRYRPADTYDSYGRPSPARSTEDKENKKPLSAPGGGAKVGEDGKKSAAAKQEDQKTKYEADKKTDAYERSFIESIESFGLLFDEVPAFKNIERHVSVETTSPVNDEVINAIKTGTKSITKATNAVKGIKKQLNNLNDAQKKAYKKSIKDSYKEVRSDFDKLNTQIANLEKPEQGRKLAMMPQPQERNAFMSKYFAYFGRKYENFLQKEVDDARKIAGANPLPTNIKRIEDLLSKSSVPDLSELRTKIMELNRIVDTL